MAIFTGKKLIPARTILYDIVYRTSSQTAEKDSQAVSPYPGMNEEVLALSKKAVIPMVSIFRNYTQDYDANAQKPSSEKYSLRTKEEKEHITSYEINLEHIDASWIQQRVRNLMRSFRTHRDGAERIAREHMKDQPTFVDEDGDEVELLDLKLDEDIATLSEYEKDKYRKKLTYLIKRLSMFGAAHRVHMMSLIIAHEKAKRLMKQDNRSSAKNNGKAKQQDILAFGYFKGDAFGGYVTDNDGNPVILATNKNAFADWIYDFLVGNETEYEDAYSDYTELLAICSDIGIDLVNEDPRVYTGSFISDLAITYVINNKKYLQDLYNGNVVKKAISSMVLDSYAKERHVKNDRDVKAVLMADQSKLINYNISKFYASNNSYIQEAKNAYNIGTIRDFLRVYRIIFPKIEKISDVPVTVDGFLADSNCNVLTFYAGPLCSRDHLNVQTLFIIHISGILVRLTTDNTLLFLQPQLYQAYMALFLKTANMIGESTKSLSFRYRAVVNEIINYQGPIYRKKYGYWPTTN